MTEREAETQLPLVAIIGRPNVGKSTLFNRLIGSRRSIVGDLPGMTRDRIYGEVEWQGRGWRLVDTGGIVPDDEAMIPSRIFAQARTAIAEARLLLLVVDIREGITPLDEELVRHLRATEKPVLVVANKAEGGRIVDLAGEFHRFGFINVVPVSAEHGAGTAVGLSPCAWLVGPQPMCDRIHESLCAADRFSWRSCAAVSQA